MRISDAFPSNYLKAANLNGGNARVTISHVAIEEIGDERKPVLYFQGKEKGMVLNKTNANNISSLYGDDTEDWQGKEIVLFPAMVDFQGKTVEAIRVRAPQKKDGPTYMSNGGVTEPPARQLAAAPNDDIPF
jgi:hypothetical protein